MHMESRDVGEVAVVDVIGRLTGADVGALSGRVARLLAEGRMQLVLNLGQLSYMDSSGLGEVVSCYTKVQRAGGKIRIAETTHRIQDLLAITRLVTVFECFDTEEQAVLSNTPTPR